MFYKPQIFCDRRIYDKRGKWYNHDTKEWEQFFYYVKEPLTLASSFENGREQLKPSITITMYGAKPITKDDIIKLEDNTKLRVQGYTVNYLERNVLVRDMLKPMVESLDIELE